MNRLVALLCVALMAIGMLSCSSSENQETTNYNRSKVEEIIANHDTTILYFMASWCQASQSDFENNMKPFLGKASDTKAIVVVCIGESESVMNLNVLKDNMFLFNKASRLGFFDKFFINNECNRLLIDYKQVNYVPLEIACNRYGEILNWDTNEESGRTYGFIYPYLRGWK